MSMNYLDILLVCILGLFALRGVFQGFIAEAAGLISLLGGFWCSYHYYPQAAPYITFVEDAAWRQIIAYAAIFLGVFLLTGILARILQKLLSLSFMVWLDKLAGLVFGLLKGLVICSLLLIAIKTFLDDAPFLRSSVITPYLRSVIETLYDLLPPDLFRKFGI